MSRTYGFILNYTWSTPPTGVQVPICDLETQIQYLKNYYNQRYVWFDYLGHQVSYEIFPPNFFGDFRNLIGLGSSKIQFFFDNIDRRSGQTYTTETNLIPNFDVYYLPLHFVTTDITYCDDAGYIRGGDNNYYKIFSIGRTVVSFVKSVSDPSIYASPFALPMFNGTTIIENKSAPNGVPINPAGQLVVSNQNTPAWRSLIVFPIKNSGMAAFLFQSPNQPHFESQNSTADNIYLVQANNQNYAPSLDTAFSFFQTDSFITWTDCENVPVDLIPITSSYAPVPNSIDCVLGVTKPIMGNTPVVQKNTNVGGGVIDQQFLTSILFSDMRQDTMWFSPSTDFPTTMNVPNWCSVAVPVEFINQSPSTVPYLQRVHTFIMNADRSVGQELFTSTSFRCERATSSGVAGGGAPTIPSNYITDQTMTSYGQYFISIKPICYAGIGIYVATSDICINNVGFAGRSFFQYMRQSYNLNTFAEPIVNLDPSLSLPFFTANNLASGTYNSMSVVNYRNMAFMRWSPTRDQQITDGTLQDYNEAVPNGWQQNFGYSYNYFLDDTPLKSTIKFMKQSFNFTNYYQYKHTMATSILFKNLIFELNADTQNYESQTITITDPTFSRFKYVSGLFNFPNGGLLSNMLEVSLFCTCVRPNWLDETLPIFISNLYESEIIWNELASLSTFKFYSPQNISGQTFNDLGLSWSVALPASTGGVVVPYVGSIVSYEAVSSISLLPFQVNTGAANLAVGNDGWLDIAPDGLITLPASTIDDYLMISIPQDVLTQYLGIAPSSQMQIILRYYPTGAGTPTPLSIQIVNIDGPNTRVSLNPDFIFMGTYYVHFLVTWVIPTYTTGQLDSIRTTYFAATSPLTTSIIAYYYTFNSTVIATITATDLANSLPYGSPTYDHYLTIPVPNTIGVPASPDYLDDEQSRWIGSDFTNITSSDFPSTSFSAFLVPNIFSVGGNFSDSIALNNCPTTIDGLQLVIFIVFYLDSANTLQAIEQFLVTNPITQTVPLNIGYIVGEGYTNIRIGFFKNGINDWAPNFIAQNSSVSILSDGVINISPTLFFNY